MESLLLVNNRKQRIPVYQFNLTREGTIMQHFYNEYQLYIQLIASMLLWLWSYHTLTRKQDHYTITRLEKDKPIVLWKLLTLLGSLSTVWHLILVAIVYVF